MTYRLPFFCKADIWKTDLDVLFGKLNGYRFTFFSQLRTINESEHRALFSESATLGQYFIRNSKSLSETFYELDESGHFSIEFANFVVALLILTSRYPSVFWRANKCFSLVFSLHLLFNLVQSIFTYAAFQVAFKIFVCDPTHLLIPYRDASSLSLTQLGSLLCVYLLLLHMSSLAVHVYGIQKYRDYRYARTKYMQDKYQSKPWFSYFSYFLAMAFFLLLSVLVGPLFYEFVIIYCGSLSIAPLLFILSTIAYYTFCILFWMCLAIKTKWSFEYDDFESDPFLAKKPANLEHSPLVIINGATVYRVKEDIAKQAIVNFVQTHLPSTQVAEENCSNLFLDRAQQNRVSFKSAQSEKPCGRFNKSANGRYSTRSYTKKSFDYQDASDSDCEYTTFQKTPKSQSFRLKVNTFKDDPAWQMYNYPFLVFVCLQQNFTTLPKATGTNEQHPVNMVTQSYTSVDDEPTYGFNFMFNSLLTSDEPSSPTLGNDKGSDTSSGIHSATSNSSTGISSSDKDKSNSLESLMETLAKLEAAVADKPNLRSLSQFRYNTIPTTVAVTYPQGPPNDVANRLY